MPRQTGEHGEAGDGSVELADVDQRRCAAAPESAIATLEPSPARAAEGHCGASLELADGRLTIRAIPFVDEGLVAAAGGVGELLGAGPVPDECGPALERCELWGVDDELGPVVLTAVRGPESEVPTQVHVGWIEGGRLGFAPTWYGLPSVADHTRVGPAWALAPFACAGALLLLPSARLPEAEVEQPSEAVVAAAGRWTIADDGVASLVEPRTSGDGCRALFVALP